MRVALSWSIICVAVSLLGACGSAPDANLPRPAPQNPPSVSPERVNSTVVSSMVLAKELDSNQLTLLQNDLKTIASFDATLSDAEDNRTRSIMGLPDLSPQSLNNWLNERMKYVIAGRDSLYPMAIVYPKSRELELIKLTDRQDEANIAATNVGTGYLLEAKNRRTKDGRPQYLRIQINQKWIDLISPRVGLMQIGPALFNFRVNKQNPDAFSNSALRIQTIFHEARHSDGASENANLGFQHVICLSNSTAPAELIGKFACDNSGNGAYSVGAGLARAFWKKCGDQCSMAEKLILQAVYLDSVSRVVPIGGSPPRDKNSTPEPSLEAVDTSNFKIINGQ